MAGQAAVGVVVNLVQVVGAAISLSSRRRISAQDWRTPEEMSAFMSFAFATCFLCVSLVAHCWLVRTPAYATMIAPFELRRLVAGEHEERQSLMSSSHWAQTTERETTRERIVRVARVNVVYEMAIAYVFVVTLVRLPLMSCESASLLMTFVLHSPSFRL